MLSSKSVPVNAIRTGATYLALPETYKGYLRLSSSNGNLSLGEALGRNSKLISGGGSKDLIYYVSPSSKDTVFAQDEKSAFGELEDNCHCHSVSGRIRVGYYGSLDDLDTDRGFAWMKEDDTGCCIVG